MVKMAATNQFDINYSPTIQTFLEDRDIMLYYAFSFNCQERQLLRGIFDVLSNSATTLKSLTLTNLPIGCRVCIYDLFRKLKLGQYLDLQELVVSRTYEDECYVKLGDTLDMPTNITSLTLYGLGLVSIPSAIFDLKFLSHLSLANNIIASIEELTASSAAGSITELDVSRNSLTNIPSNIDRLVHLTVLNLGHNSIKKCVPDSLANIKALREVILEWNRILSIPNEVLSTMGELKILNLANNKIQPMIPAMCFHSSLEILNLSGNEKLVFLDDDLLESELQQSPSLQELYLSNTSLTSLPTWLYRLNQLKVLDCQYSNLTNIDLINSIPSLQEANFSHNAISSYSQVVEHISKEETHSLRTLTLTFNNLDLDEQIQEHTIHIKNTDIILLQPFISSGGGQHGSFSNIEKPATSSKEVRATSCLICCART